MADTTYRLLPLQKLTAHLKGITKANGYRHDLNNAVFRGRAVFGENDPIPMLSILESPRSDQGDYAGQNDSERKEGWSLMLQGWSHDDVENPTDPAYFLMDDVEKHLARIVARSEQSGFVMYPDEYMLQGSISGLTVLPGVVRPPMEGVSSKAFFYLPIRITLVRDHG